MAEDDGAELDMAAAMAGQAKAEAKKSAASPKKAARSDGRMEAVYEVPVEVTAVLGTASLQVSQILKLGRGAVVELDRIVGEPVDINANNRLIARGEVVVVEDRLAIQITDIIRSNIR
nr:Flagellar motor switch/type III secretory pathway protein [uncultured bacterium]